MASQSSTSNTPFVLFPVMIPGWVTPVEPQGLADGGIPKRIYDDRPDGCECWIDPWTEFQARTWTMGAGDSVALFVNDETTSVDDATVQPGEEARPIVLHIPRGRLRNGVNRLHYKVSRLSGNDEDSRDLNVLYHLLSPGADDPDDTSINMDLVVPQDVEQHGVSAARAAEGVTFGFNYANQRAYDTVRFQLSTETIELPVNSPSESVATTLYTNTFRLIGDNPRTFARFLVIDQLGNDNQSAAKYLDVHLDRVTVPIITLVLDRQGNEIPEGGITLDTSITVQGTASNGDDIQLYGNGSPVGSSFAVVGTTWSHTLSNLGVAVYSLTARLGAVSSEPRIFTITQLVKPTLPKAYNVAGTRLKMGFNDVKDLYREEFLDVVVPPYTGSRPDHILNVIWKGRAVTYTELNPVAGQRILRVPRLEFVDSIGGEVEASYSVQPNNTSTALLSEPWQGIFDEQALALPAPLYNSSTHVVTVSDTSSMGRYKIRVRWDGLVTRDGPEIPLDVNRPYTFTIDSSWVSENRGQTVLLNYTLRLDASNPILFSHYLRIPV
ncbi:hypothetical protein OC610_06205 [Pseudomonas sp. SAICEU22]|uniref:Ig-like domain-containing protein n=1 Tax=Pseudomonas agronomica TaxID=2979328 RepID=A0ABT3F4S9_9PSED|nr:hypothetical protein [Pseudomonas agronomica]MCW1243992.1 hypothetical protein [Pseudomonas agronomica]